ncbi:MAG: hypothetical protein EHM64_00920 [Ignavibacteriae bacterium]|nr:MAG: hypothetical protein EHM64_00920 [Ignavibacteriota bacterium]
MNKQTRHILTIASILFYASNCFAQDAEPVINPVSTINLIGRYTEGKGVEIRFFPDKKSVLEVGFKEGFIIERMLFDTSIIRKDPNKMTYAEIARIFPYSDTQWETALRSEKSLESKNELEIARDFLKNIDKGKGGAFNFEKGIAELKDQKSKEDFEYMIFTLTALKDAKAATALGLAYTDSTAIKGKTYFYRARPVGKSDVYTVISVDYRIVAENLKKGYDNPVYVKQGDTELFFAWIETPDLSGYFVERANPGETTFTQLNKAPIHNLEGSAAGGESRSGFNDKNLINYQVYTYRFFGYTLFGEKVQFAEVKAMPKDLTPPEQPFLPQPQNVKPNEVLVTWQMNPVPAPDLKGFFVARANKNEGDFKVLHQAMLPKEARTFTDTTFVRGQANYYVVQAMDTANNVSSSFPVSVTLIDSIPPGKPAFLSGTIDSLGVVTITVKKSKEKDLMGYRLFKANSPEHEFSVMVEGFVENDSLNQEIQTVFKDTVTLNSLTPFIYYKVKALDFNYNQSDFSDLLKVARPDTIAPVSPIFTSVVVKEKQVELFFVSSSSADVQEHILYRKTDLKSEWQILSMFSSLLSKFIDTNVTTGVTYYYSIRAKDFGGLYSHYASAVYGKPYDTGIRPPIENLNAKVEKKNIILTWNYPSSKVEPSFIVYKKDDNGNLTQYDITTEKSYTDKNAHKTNYYAIKAVMKDGGQSTLSEVVGKIIE